MPAKNVTNKNPENPSIYVGSIKTVFWTLELSQWIRDSISLTFLIMVRMWSESAHNRSREVGLHRELQMNFFPMGRCSHPPQPRWVPLSLPLLTWDPAPGIGAAASHVTSPLLWCVGLSASVGSAVSGLLGKSCVYNTTLKEWCIYVFINHPS